MNDSPLRVGPGNTPRSIKILVLTFLIVAVLSALSTQLFRFFGPYPPQRLLSLNLWGIENLYLWQFITYPFVAPGPITFFFAIYLGFMAYLLWVVGSALVQRVGEAPFLRLLGLSVLLSGLAAGAIMALTHSNAVLLGPTCLLYTLLTAWVMFYPDLQLMLFLAIPVRLKWLILVILGINLFTDLGQGDYPLVVAYLVSLATGYLYALLAWNLRSPFPVTHRFDEWVADIGVRIRSRQHTKASSKVYDFRTGKAVQDDSHFMEYVLDKISRYGEKSLTWRERRRLRKLSKKR